MNAVDKPILEQVRESLEPLNLHEIEIAAAGLWAIAGEWNVIAACGEKFDDD